MGVSSLETFIGWACKMKHSLQEDKVFGGCPARV